jgi:long-subunit acyl-CoA synthetase (AMP-forming)
MPPQHHTRNGLGRPLPCIEIKLVASTHDGFSESRNIYRGHIHIRGPSLPKPPGTGLDLTSNSSSSDNDEWVSTGRIGEWHASQQSLRVIDNLIEPLTARYLGDYIPIEKLEATYKKVDYVRECVLLHTWKCVQLIGIISKLALISTTCLLSGTLFLNTESDRYRRHRAPKIRFYEPRRSLLATGSRPRPPKARNKRRAG